MYMRPFLKFEKKTPPPPLFSCGEFLHIYIKLLSYYRRISWPRVPHFLCIWYVVSILLDLIYYCIFHQTN